MEQEIKTTEQQDVPQAVLTADDLSELYFLVEDKKRDLNKREAFERAFLYLFRHNPSSELFTDSVKKLDELCFARDFYEGLLCRLNEALGVEPLCDD